MLCMGRAYTNITELTGLIDYSLYGFFVNNLCGICENNIHGHSSLEVALVSSPNIIIVTKKVNKQV